MLSVAITINGNPIMARSAVNRGQKNKQGEELYRVDDGSGLWHNPDDGAVALAMKLLATIKEQR